MSEYEKIKALISNLPFWNILTNNQKSLIISSVYTIEYKKGSTLRDCNQSCLGFVFLYTGQLRAYMLSEEGRELTLYRVFPQEFCVLSAACILDEITFDIFMGAEEDSKIIVINAALFKKLIDENKDMEAFTYKMIAERFSDVMWTMQQVLFKGIDKRLARFLIFEGEKNNGQVKMTHEQIAKHIGSAREVVSRMLKYFESEKAIKTFRGGLEIENKKILEKICGDNCQSL